MRKNKVKIQITGYPSSVRDMPKSLARILKEKCGLKKATKIGDIEEINMTQYGKLNDYQVKFKELTGKQLMVTEIDLSDLFGDDEPEPEVEIVGEEAVVKVHSVDEALTKARKWFKDKYDYDGELGVERKNPDHIWLYMRSTPGHPSTFKANIV